MNQPKVNVLVCVLTREERHGWVNPNLMVNLIQMSHDPRYAVAIEPITDLAPVDYARNYCVTLARDNKAHWLLMIDNDQAFEVPPLNVLAESCGKFIIGMPTMQYGEDRFKNGAMFLPNIRREVGQKDDGDFMQLSRIGTGAMYLHHSVWEQIPGPWFKFEHDGSELHAQTKPEDFHFCDLARKHGFEVWGHKRMLYHFHTIETTRVGMRMHALAQGKSGSRSEPLVFDLSDDCLENPAITR